MFRIVQRFANNFKSFEKLEDLNHYLNFNKPAQVVVYFRANWNPQCRESDKDAATLAANNAHLEVIRIDTDLSPKIGKHYSVKAEPEFVFCLYGDEILRQIGVDYQKLEEKNRKMNEFAKKQYLDGVTDKWVPYGTAYRAYFQSSLK